MFHPEQTQHIPAAVRARAVKGMLGPSSSLLADSFTARIEDNMSVVILQHQLIGF